MTIRITVPTSATDHALAQLQAHSAKSLSLIEATKSRLDISSRVADQLRLPSITIPQNLANTISSAKALADAYSQLNQPALEMSSRVQEIVIESQAIAKRFEAITAPIVAERLHLAQSIPDLTIPIREASLAAQRSIPSATVGRPLLRGAPLVRITSKASRIVNCALQRLADRQHRDADLRHRVELIVHLPNGEYIRVMKIAAKDDGLIQIIGEDIDGYARERFIAPESFQYEIVKMTVPPPDRKLTLVEQPPV